MHRRSFLTLIGASGHVRLAGAGALRRDGAAWRFALDRELRWSLLPARGPAAIAGADIAVQFADGPPVSLAELSDVRRLRGGERGAAVTTVVGRAGDVEVAATFADGAWPSARVAVRGLGAERGLTLVRLLDVPVIGPTRPRARAWINGYQSWSACRVAEIDRAAEATGHWQLALLGAPGLALAFAEDDAGAGEFTFAGGRLVAASRCGGRPVSAGLPPAVVTLTIVPGEDPLAALGDLAARSAPAPARTAPAGWCSWYELFERVTEDDVVANLEAARRAFDPRAFRVIQLDDGYQRAAGDWEMNAKFPHGHRWLTERIHSAGFDAGLWLAPFAVTERSGIPAARADWLLLGDDGRPLPFDDQPHWGGRAYGLDAAQREVRDFLRDLTRHAVTEWGYDYLKLDFLYYGARGTRPGRQLGPAEAYRAGLRALREGAGRAFVLGCGAPLQHSLGLVDGMRIGGDVSASWGGVQAGARATMLRAHLEGAWHNDPDALIVRQPLTADEARAWASVVALSGGQALASDDLPRLAADRLAILRRALPAAPVRARVLDFGAAESERPPAALLAQAADDWWTLALVNWDDEPRRMRAAVGGGGPLAVYDVWQETRRADVAGSVAITVAPRSAAVLGLRRPRRNPFVLGTTRHIVQGSVDIDRETWDARLRVLAGRSVRLDGAPYAVTIAVPPATHPRSCRTGVACHVKHVHGSGHSRWVRLEFPEPAAEIEWEVAF